ncbi:MAG: adenylate/guanylate cyclase domain-containing protein [Xanthobacteraceae bacterium]
MKNGLLRLAQTLASRRTFGLVLLALLIPIRIWDPHPLEELRLRSFDLYQNLKPRASAANPVVIVDIDESSVNTLGQWPWPRTVLADLLTRIFEMQAVVVGFDVVFPEPDRASPREAVKHFRHVDPGIRELLAHLPGNDDLFAQAIGAGRVVLGQSGTHTFAMHAPGLRPETGVATLGADPSAYLIEFPHLLRNLPELEQAAAGRGLFSIRPERDGIVRRVPIVMRADGKIVPSLALDMLRVATDSGAILIRADEAGIRSVAVAGLQLPTDQNGRVWVYFGPHNPAMYVSAKDVLAGNAAPEKFDGKLALIGASAIGLADIKITPVSAAIPGVEVHAQLLGSALTDTLLSRPNYAIAIEMLGAAAAGGVLAFVAPLASALTLLVVAVGSAAAFVAGSWFAFKNSQMLFDATFPLIVIVSVSVSLIMIGYFREQLDRRRIRSAFSHYLSPNLVERLAKSPKQLVLGGEERVMTVLFSDVRSFTTIAETYKDNPQGLTRLMNRFLTPVTDAIITRNGTIDKYIGDAVMAFWNAPLDNPDHEADACHAALDMLDRVAALNDELEREAAAGGTRFVPIRIGIGINTGRCTVGNMGSDLRFQYTVMGDSVNLASRLEGQTKGYGLSIIIGSRTAAAVSGQFALLEIDRIQVKGKTEPELIYTVVGRDDFAQAREFETLQERWSAFLVCYRKQDWPGARNFLEETRGDCQRFGIATLIDTYEDRIKRLEHEPPSSTWDGVFIADTK